MPLIHSNQEGGQVLTRRGTGAVLSGVVAILSGSSRWQWRNGLSRGFSLDSHVLPGLPLFCLALEFRDPLLCPCPSSSAQNPSKVSKARSSIAGRAAQPVRVPTAPPFRGFSKDAQTPHVAVIETSSFHCGGGCAPVLVVIVAVLFLNYYH